MSWCTRTLHPIYGPCTHRVPTVKAKKTGQRRRRLSIADEAVFARLTWLELRGIYGLLTGPYSVCVHNVFLPSSTPNLASVAMQPRALDVNPFWNVDHTRKHMFFSHSAFS